MSDACVPGAATAGASVAGSARRDGSPASLEGIGAMVAAAPARCGDTRIICIDGPAGAGKTTLAGLLGASLAAPVVHMDDLYRGWAQDIGAPLAARLAAWLLDPWEVGLPGRHLHYDWVAGRYDSWVVVAPAPIIILEGCGAASAAVRARAALTIWVQAPPELRLARGLARDGAGMAPQWAVWQQREAQHFAADGTRAAASVRWQGG